MHKERLTTPEISPDVTDHARARLTQAHRALRCCHIRPNGLRCGSPALRGAVFCYFHNEYYNGSTENTFPPLEDGNGVQLALMMVLERLRREAFRGAEANIPAIKSLLYGLQTAMLNLPNTNFDPVLASPVTDVVPPEDEVVLEKKASRGTSD